MTGKSVQLAMVGLLSVGQVLVSAVNSMKHAAGRRPVIIGQVAAGHSPVFEVVSIKPSGNNTGFSFMRTADGFTATHQTVTALVLLANLPMPLWSADRVRHAPPWANEQEFDILAKVAAEDIPAWQSHDGSKLQMAMLQSMLADRFHLVLHSEPSETPGYALVASKRRPALKVASPDEPLPKQSMRLSTGGVAVGGGTRTSPTWTFYGASMASLVDFLSMGSHTIIEDRTGLAGVYDFDLRRKDDADPYDHGDITDPASKWDFEVLGLKTIPSKVHSFNFIIDHVEKPSPN